MSGNDGTSRAVGRPSKYDPAYCERVIELGNMGASVVEMAHEIGVTRNTLETNWSAAHPEFLEAMEKAREASQVWWEKKGRDSLTTPGFQSSVWSRSMAARFPHDWREKSLVGSDPDNPLPAGFTVRLMGKDGADAGD
jgi:hypothetical protein